MQLITNKLKVLLNSFKRLKAKHLWICGRGDFSLFGVFEASQEIIARIDQPWETEGVMIDLAFLSRVVSNATAPFITIEKKNKVVIREGNSNYEMSSTAIDPFLIPPEGQPINSSILDNLKRIMFAASTDMARINLNGIYCDGQYMVATDGFRISMLPLEERNFFIPLEAANTIVSVFKRIDGMSTNGHVIVHGVDAADNRIAYRSPGLNAQFPDYQQIIRQAKVENGSMTFVVSELIGAIKRSKVIDMPILKITPGQETIVSSSDYENFYQQPVACTLEGKCEEFLINKQFLLDVLERCKEPEVKICLNTPRSPIFIEEGTWLNLIMPMMQ